MLEGVRRQAAGLSLRQLGSWLCREQDWIGPSGKHQTSVAVEILRHLHSKGHLQLQLGAPVARRKPAAVSRVTEKPALLEANLEEVQPVELIEVTSRYSKLYRVWKDLLEQHHYLGSGPLCGPQMRYVIGSPKGWLGALAFSAAARAVSARDQWIGWEASARRENLHLIVNNSRFLILPHVTVPNLASHLLSRAATRVAADWKERYGYEPVLLESFVDNSRFRGVCYQAANWQAVGMSCGRTRQDEKHQMEVSKKVLWVYPLRKDFRKRLGQMPERRRLVEAPKVPEPVVPPADWLEEEFGRCELGDGRLERRLRTVAGDFFARPQMPVPQACSSRARTKAVYRFFDHPRVNLHSVLQGHYQATATRAAREKVVLAVQDTTDLNYSAHPKTEFLGPICSAEGIIGMLVHDTMAYNPSGTPLGLIDVQCWTRDPDQPRKSEQRYDLDIEQKESSKWLASFKAAKALQKQLPDTTVISVGDREADLYELLVEALADDAGPKLLIRAQQDRVLKAPASTERHLWEFVQGLPEAGRLEITPPRTKKRPSIPALLEVRFAEVQLEPPKRKPHLGPVKAWAVVAEEKQAPDGVEPLQWLLLTTHRVETFAQAVEKLEWYAQRFQIEVYHRTLKSGCKIEERQLGNAERIEACLAIDMVVAWRIVQLTKLGREVPDVPCTVFFEDAQWKALKVFATGNPNLTHEVPTLKEATRLMAMTLGGFLGRKSDGEPGAETLWRGLQRLDDITVMWSFMQRQHWLPPTSRELLDTS
jgi:hypothetical protein